MGENEPDEEAARYAGEVRRIVPDVHGWPRFNWMLLGLGSDGHTASLFPDRMDLKASARCCESVRHPETKQPRITMTPGLINNAARISFLVTGTTKRAILQELNRDPDEAAVYPAETIDPVQGILEWWMDEEAASMNSHGQ
jgi:6-phosphogluconolactonase